MRRSSTSRPNGRSLLVQACAGDEALRREVESLIAAHEKPGSFVDAPAYELAADLLRDDRPGPRVGQQISHYEVLGKLGAGGMGEVHLALDTRLNRKVAIKLLPTEFTSNVERVTRFEQEARAASALNHPNIMTVYEIGEVEQRRYIVTEYIEGQTLRQRMASAPQGRIRLSEALEMAAQVAGALQAAHEAGITHRDIKPENVMVRQHGLVKVLDFGLAKPSNRPTDSRLSEMDKLSTRDGVVMGTVSYMSPEQARGEKVDHRTDIFSLGVMVYEMLSGLRPFDGATASDVVAAVLTKDPEPLGQVAPAVPAGVQRVVTRCLEKQPGKRFQSASDLSFALQALAEPMAISAPPRGSSIGRIASLGVVAAIIVALAIPAARHLRETSQPELRLQIVTPSTKAPYQFALSPDGRHIAFLASGSGPQRLWLQPLDKTEARPMSGTDGADFPFWSADSRSIGFFASGKLYRIDIAGGPPQPLTNTSATTARGGAWSTDGTILFAPMPNGPLSKIAASGGEAVVVTQLDPPRQLGHRLPQFLPDGRHFIFYATGNPEASGIYLGSLDGGQPKRLTKADTAGAYLNPDRIIFVHHGALVARRLDLGKGELTGDLVTLADRVGIEVYRGGFSVSTDGRVAYRSGGRAERRQLTWLDRRGKTLGVVGEPEATNLLFPEMSPDGRRVALVRTVENNQAVWLMDLVRGGFTRLTWDVAADFAPLWSPPDGALIAFSSNRTGFNNLYLRASNSSLAGTEELLRESRNNNVPQDWSKDGRFLLYVEISPKMNRDLWALEMAGKERKPREVVNTPFEERMGQFSPDGRWVAYETNESGRFEVVVQPFPAPSAKWPVSTSGGNQPRWRADGKEIYFIAPDGKLMAVPVTTRGPMFQAGTPVALFPTRLPAGGGAELKHQYAVSRDGRFLINQTVEESTNNPITLILNWKP